MTTETVRRTGGCLCGAVRYETTSESFKILNCHCTSCRKHTGAPMVTLACFKVDQVVFTGETRKIYSSSPGVGRAFCGSCGTPLTWESDDGDLGPVLELHVSTFDDPEAIRPILHTFDAERISWFEVDDALPRYEGNSITSRLLRHGPATDR